MVAAVAINPNLSVVPSPQEDLVRAIALYEQGNQMLIEAGRLFSDIKQETKKKFNKLVEVVGLDKAQVSKVIKAAECADEIPSVVASKLGIQMLLQLGQKRNVEARGAIAYSDTQLEVAQKMKELRLPVERKEKEPVRWVGTGRGVVGKLRIEIEACAKAIELERNWRESRMPPVEWLSQILEPRSDKPREELMALILEDTTSVSEEIEVIPINEIVSSEMVMNPTKEALIEAASVAAEIDYEQLSVDLLKVKKWEKVSEVVLRDGMVLKEVIAGWSAVQKEELINRAIIYIEKTPMAIKDHEMDWLPIENLFEVLHKLSFKVKDILEGLESPWYEDCALVNVINFGNHEDEVWTFSSEGREIKTWSRSDFEVIAF